MTLPKALAALVLLLIAAAPFMPIGGTRQYVLHVLVQIFIWSFIAGAWSLMGRFGLVSLGHGAFLGVGAYTATLLWNAFGLTPWLGSIGAVTGAMAVALVVGYPCYLLRVVGHYFALVTLAVGEVVRLLIIAGRTWTGGSLGLTLRPAPPGASLVAVQFADRRVFYYAAIVVWLGGLYLWRRLDRSMARSALEAIGEDETAAASMGIDVTKFKLGVTALSAGLTALGGVLYAQYITYVSPETLSGIGVSLRIVFAAVLGGMYTLLGPTVGTALTIALSEYLRVTFGIRLIGMAETIYGLALILFIIFLPAGLYGGISARVRRRAAAGRPAFPRPSTQESVE
ncbi:MAG TPA: branched-chain amino acid ABC transporter permease [bacterium]|nr:branched-chain amino acid ABC transporter permease [bacterium]